MSHPSAAFFGIERSLGGRKWQACPADERLAQAICQKWGVPEVVGRVLSARGIDLEAVGSFLNPTLRESLPDPFHLVDMDKAAERLADAVIDGQMIAVFGDYDVDGATSSALLGRFFRAVGAKTRIYIPDRMVEGYGPNSAALLQLHREGAGIIVTVDCGTTAFEPLREAAEAGLSVIVVDHHEAEAELPAAFAVINPKRMDETSPHGHMAAVGVAFLLAVAVNRRLKDKGYYGPQRSMPDLLQWLDIVALGTVCDVVPLIGCNRALVAQGLKVMGKRANKGLAALADIGGIRERLDSYHLGYILGPRVNAGGRVGQADLGTRLLQTEDPDEAARLAKQLDAFNQDRQQIEMAVLLEAIEQVEGRSGVDGLAVIAAGDDWHPGVIGIVAGRLKERYNRPTCVIAFEGDEGKGSARSVNGVDLGAAIIAARQEGLLIKGGGHAMAAGFTLSRDKLEDFRAFLEQRLAVQIQEGLVPVLDIDGAVDLGGCTPDLVESLKQIGPFGAGNPEPKFLVPQVRIVKADVVGSGHVRCILTGAAGQRLKAIAFRAVDSDLGVALLQSTGRALHLVGTLRLDNWQGRSEAQMFIEDAAFAG